MQENNDKQLEKRLQAMAKEAKPDKNFEQMLKVRLRERFHVYHENKTARRIGFWNRFKIQLSSAFVITIFASTTMYAYASDDITNGHILYSLKRSAEKVEEVFATSPESKTNYYNKMAGRRMREIAVLQKRGIKDEATIKETDNFLARAELAAREVPDEEIQVQNDDQSDINLTDQKTSIADEIEQTSPRKTRREKALKEIASIRVEFKKEFADTFIPINAAPVNTAAPVIMAKPEIKVKNKDENKIEDRTEKKPVKTPRKDKKDKKENSNKIENNPVVAPINNESTTTSEVITPGNTTTQNNFIIQNDPAIPANIVTPIDIPTTDTIVLPKINENDTIDPELYNLKQLKKELKKLENNRIKLK